MCVCDCKHIPFSVRQPEQCVSVCVEKWRTIESGTEARREWLYVNAQKGIAKKCQRCHVRPANIHQVAVSHLKSNTLASECSLQCGKKKSLDSQTFHRKSVQTCGACSRRPSSHVGKVAIDSISRASLNSTFFFSASEMAKGRRSHEGLTVFSSDCRRQFPSEIMKPLPLTPVVLNETLKWYVRLLGWV